MDRGAAIISLAPAPTARTAVYQFSFPLPPRGSLVTIRGPRIDDRVAGPKSIAMARDAISKSAVGHVWKATLPSAQRSKGTMGCGNRSERFGLVRMRDLNPPRE